MAERTASAPPSSLSFSLSLPASLVSRAACGERLALRELSVLLRLWEAGCLEQYPSWRGLAEALPCLRKSGAMPRKAGKGMETGAARGSGDEQEEAWDAVESLIQQGVLRESDRQAVDRAEEREASASGKRRPAQPGRL